MKHFFLYLFLVLGTGMLGAQSGKLIGVLRDSRTQQPLVGANVVLLNTSFGALTNEAGAFALTAIPAGTYQVAVTSLGFQNFSEAVTVAAGAIVTLDRTLEPGSLTLEAVTVSAQEAHTQQVIGKIDLSLRPIVNSQEILRMVPGLFMGQHAGGGKAEQIFLRGFDIDHGTDIQLTVDGLPVNMVSHAHGQGYADLHFVIPELVERVAFEKGPYHADKGNFNTAGWVDFRTKEVLDRNLAKLEVGQYNTFRGVAAVDLLGAKARENNQGAYLAAEYSYSDSYFDAPQYFNRVNVQGRYSGDLSAYTRLSLTGSHFWSRWNHSGQIPDRAVDQGLISFFGAIDPTEGGETSRSNLNAQLYTRTKRGGLFKNQFYYSRYEFELYSNFTFFLDDPLNGDQIRQKEGRDLFGYQGSYSFNGQRGKIGTRTNIGVQYRQDAANDVELSNTRNRSITEENLQLGDVREINAGVYVDESLQFSERWSLNLGLRYDFFRNQYQDQLQEAASGIATAGIFSPKVNLYFTPSNQLQFYLRSGRGFHSNDSRVVVPQRGREILPGAYGLDLGTYWKPNPRLLLQAALWGLWLEQEFVYVGDAGIIEPSGRSNRSGLEFSARYQLTERLFADADLNLTRPRATDEPTDANRIPLAPTFTTTGGLTLYGSTGWNGSLRYRFMGDRPANEDNSIVAAGYFVADAQINFTRKRWEIGLNLQNLFNTRWKETQFATESRLFDEAEPVEEIHFTPGTPFFARLAFSLFF